MYSFLFHQCAIRFLSFEVNPFPHYPYLRSVTSVVVANDSGQVYEIKERWWKGTLKLCQDADYEAKPNKDFSGFRLTRGRSFCINALAGGRVKKTDTFTVSTRYAKLRHGQLSRQRPSYDDLFTSFVLFEGISSIFNTWTVFEEALFV